MAVVFENIRPSVSETSRTKALVGKFGGILSRANRKDDYSLSIPRQEKFSASLTGLQSDAALQVLTKDGRILARSDRTGRRSESIQKTLTPGMYFIRVLRRGGKTNYTLTITDKPKSSNPPVNPTPSINLFQNLWGEYRGTSVTTTGLINPMSGQFLTAPKSFQTNITVRVKAPIAVGNIAENNPFNLSVSSSGTDLGNAVLGAIAVYSASSNFQTVLGQSWSLQYSGDQITGMLTNSNNISVPSAPNYFFADSYISPGVRSLFSSPMNAGTTLQGTLISSKIQLRLQGSSGSSRAFIIDVAAQRI